MIKFSKYLFVVFISASTAASFADDVDDFSLDAGGGEDGNDTTTSSGGDVLNDLGGESNLFGDSIPNVPITNSGKSKLSDNPANPKLNSPVPTNSVQDKKQSAPNPTSQNSKSANAVNPANVSAPPAVKQPTPQAPQTVQAPNAPAPTEQAGETQATSVNTEAGMSPQAPLSGDGSAAPVKQVEYLPSTNQFGGVPPLPGTRRDMAPGEAPEFYAVEEGDTMFDVCSQLIDDGNYWPKLWSLNPEVRNPHFIYPGMKLAFYSGDAETPPFIEVVTEDEVVPVEKGEVQEAELVAEAEEVPIGGKEGVSSAVVPVFSRSNVPPPIGKDDEPPAIVGASDVNADADSLDGFIFSGRIFNRDDVDFVVPAFVFDDEKEPLAEVLEGYQGQNIAGDDEVILLRPEDDLGVGTYSVLRPTGDVRSLRSGEFVGYRYDFAGHIRVTRKTKTGLLEGIVFDSRTPVKSGDIVVNFIATKRNIPSVSTVGAVSTAKSSVIGFQDPEKSMGGKGDLVFLEKEGLSVGGYYAIFRTEQNRSVTHASDDDVTEDAGSIAVVRVLEIDGQSALGYIATGNAEVKVGDSLSL